MTTDSLNDSELEWPAWARWGFVDNAGGTIAAKIGPFQALVVDCPFSVDAVRVKLRRLHHGTTYEVAGDGVVLPGTASEMDIRAQLLKVMERDAPKECKAAVRNHFWVSARERRELVVAALDGGAFPHRITFRNGLPVPGPSGLHQLGVELAQTSDDTWLLQRMAREPDEEFRRCAILNPAMSVDHLWDLAEDENPEMSSLLLHRFDLPAEALRRVVTTVLAEPVLDQRSINLALEREDFPMQHLEAVARRRFDASARSRIDFAREAWCFRADRRDQIHEHLIDWSRKAECTLELIDVVVGDDPARAAWLTSHPAAGIRKLACWWAGRTGLSVAGRTPPPPPDPAMVAARLRRWWLAVAGNGIELRRTALGDALGRCRLRIRDDALVVAMPYDFGDESLVEHAVQERLCEQVRYQSRGSVNRIIWEYDESVTVPSHASAGDTDVHDPGDPVMRDWADFAAVLFSAIKAEKSSATRTLLGKLKIAGLSAHWVWLAMPTEQDKAAIDGTPQSAAVLREAIAKAQQVPVDEVGFTVLVDRVH